MEEVHQSAWKWISIYYTPQISFPVSEIGFRRLTFRWIESYANFEIFFSEVMETLQFRLTKSLEMVLILFIRLLNETWIISIKCYMHSTVLLLWECTKFNRRQDRNSGHKITFLTLRTLDFFPTRNLGDFPGLQQEISFAINWVFGSGEACSEAPALATEWIW